MIQYCYYTYLYKHYKMLSGHNSKCYFYWHAVSYLDQHGNVQQFFLHSEQTVSLLPCPRYWRVIQLRSPASRNCRKILKAKKQECIPVGCVPPAHWPYAVAVVSARGVRGMHAPMPHMPPTTHAPLPCTPPVTHAPRHTPHHARPPCHACPPVDRILDTLFWKYYLAPTSLLAVTNCNCII